VLNPNLHIAYLRLQLGFVAQLQVDLQLTEECVKP
jgi:hypothetical protein